MKGGDSSGKSVSRGDPAESVANELFTIRLRRVTAGAYVFHATRRHTDHPRKASARNGNDKERIDSLVNHTIITVSVLVARERRSQTYRKMNWKKRWVSDAVTSPSLFSLDQGAAEDSYEAD